MSKISVVQDHASQIEVTLLSNRIVDKSTKIKWQCPQCNRIHEQSVQSFMKLSYNRCKHDPKPRVMTPWFKEHLKSYNKVFEAAFSDQKKCQLTGVSTKRRLCFHHFYSKDLEVTNYEDPTQGIIILKVIHRRFHKTAKNSCTFADWQSFVITNYPKSRLAAGYRHQLVPTVI